MRARSAIWPGSPHEKRTSRRPCPSGLTSAKRPRSGRLPQSSMFWTAQTRGPRRGAVGDGRGAGGGGRGGGRGGSGPGGGEGGAGLEAELEGEEGGAGARGGGWHDRTPAGAARRRGRPYVPRRVEEPRGRA